MSKMIKIEDGVIYVNAELNEIHFNAGINDESMSKLIELLISMENKLLKQKKTLKRKIRDFEKESETKDSKDEKDSDKLSKFDITPKIYKMGHSISWSYILL